MNYTLLTITLIFIAFDCLTGVIQSFLNKTLSSKALREGIKHKGAFVLIIVLAALCQYTTNTIPDTNLPISILTPVCIYIIFTEVVSIIENIGKMNEDIMNSKLLSLFNVSNDKESEDDDKS